MRIFCFFFYYFLSFAFSNLFSRHSSLRQVAHQSASHEARVKDKMLEGLVSSLEAKYNSADLVAADLVGNWLFAEVDRRRQGENAQVAARAVQHAAHATALDLVGTVLHINAEEANKH